MLFACIVMVVFVSLCFGWLHRFGYWLLVSVLSVVFGAIGFGGFVL